MEYVGSGYSTLNDCEGFSMNDGGNTGGRMVIRYPPPLAKYSGNFGVEGKLRRMIFVEK